MSTDIHTSSKHINRVSQASLSNELDLTERLLLCPGAPYHSAWLAFYMRLLPSQATPSISEQQQDTDLSKV